MTDMFARFLLEGDRQRLLRKLEAEQDHGWRITPPPPPRIHVEPTIDPLAVARSIRYEARKREHGIEYMRYVRSARRERRAA